MESAWWRELRADVGQLGQLDEILDYLDEERGVAINSICEPCEGSEDELTTMGYLAMCRVILYSDDSNAGYVLDEELQKLEATLYN